MVDLGLEFLGASSRGHPDLRVAQRHIQQGRHLPGQAQDGQAVGPVGGHRHFQNHVGDLQGLGQVPAQRQILGNIHQAHMVLGQPQFVFRTEHPFGGDTPEFGRLDLLAAEDHRPDRGKRIETAQFQVGGAAHHPVGAAAVVNFRQPQAIRLGMWFNFGDLSHHHPGKTRGQPFDGIYFQARHGEAVRQDLRSHGELDKIRQPVKRKTHNGLI